MSPPDEHRLVLEEQLTPTSQPVSALPDEAGKPAEPQVDTSPFPKAQTEEVLSGRGLDGAERERYPRGES